jgi:uncharacterized RDD family membrane protein YckC
VNAVAQPASSGGPYAGIVTRAVAFVLDLLILNGVLFGGALVVGLIIEAFGTFAPHLDVGGIALAGAVWSIAFAIYFVGWWSLTGQTPGMRALGVKVLPTNGDRLPPRRGVVRVFGMLIAAIPFFAGYLLILVQNRRRGLHDLIARTVVVYVEEESGSHPARSARTDVGTRTRAPRGAGTIAAGEQQWETDVISGER